MRCSKLLALAFCAGAVTVVGGCQTVGPKAIGLGRDRYNGVLHSTSMEQTMSNIVRAYYYEPPMFMDVTEVDAAMIFGGSVSGGVNNIGARAGSSGGTIAGRVGTASGGVQYSESPTIRYQPLLGQALVAQLVTPVSVDALGELYDSYWDIGALLDLSSAYLTLDYREFYPALNTIIELNHRGALELAAANTSMTLSGQPEAKAPAISAAPSGQPASTKTAVAASDALIIYLRPFHRGTAPEDLAYKQRVLQLWVRLLRIYADSQPPFLSPAQCVPMKLSLDANELQDWDVHIGAKLTGVADQNTFLETARECLPNAIELRVSPLPWQSNAAGVQLPAFGSYAPVMRTYSALGILKNATERPNPKIEFVTPQQYRQIRDDPWNADVDTSSYYTLTPEELDSFNCPQNRKQQGGCDTASLTSSQIQHFNTEIDQWIHGSASAGAAALATGTQMGSGGYPSGLDVYEPSGQDVLDPRIINMNGRLGTLRRYVLVIVDEHSPGESAYASYSYGDKWFYIEKGDTVSEKNFQLLALFMTMMAVPSSSPPLSPSINVGG